MREQSKFSRRWSALAILLGLLIPSTNFAIAGRDFDSGLYGAQSATSSLGSYGGNGVPKTKKELIEEIIRRANSKTKDPELQDMRREYGNLYYQNRAFKQGKEKADKDAKRAAKEKERLAQEALDKAGKGQMGAVKSASTQNIDQAQADCGGPQIQGKIAQTKKVIKGVGAITSHIKKSMQALAEQDLQKRREAVKDIVGKAKADYLKSLGWDDKKKQFDRKLAKAKRGKEEREKYGSDPMALYAAGQYGSDDDMKKYYKEAIDWLKKSNMEAAMAFFARLEGRLEAAALEADQQKRLKTVTQEISDSARQWKQAAEDELVPAASTAASFCPNLAQVVWGNQNPPQGSSLGGLQKRVVDAAVSAVQPAQLMSQSPSMQEVQQQQLATQQAQQGTQQQFAQGIASRNKKMQACVTGVSAKVSDAIGTVDTALGQIDSQNDPYLVPETTARAMTSLQEGFNQGIGTIDAAVGRCVAIAKEKKFLEGELKRLKSSGQGGGEQMVGGPGAGGPLPSGGGGRRGHRL